MLCVCSLCVARRLSVVVVVYCLLCVVICYGSLFVVARLWLICECRFLRVVVRGCVLAVVCRVLSSFAVYVCVACCRLIALCCNCCVCFDCRVLLSVVCVLQFYSC